MADATTANLMIPFKSPDPSKKIVNINEKLKATVESIHGKITGEISDRKKEKKETEKKHFWDKINKQNN